MYNKYIFLFTGLLEYFIYYFRGSIYVYTYIYIYIYTCSMCGGLFCRFRCMCIGMCNMMCSGCWVHFVGREGYSYHMNMYMYIYM